MRAYAPTTVPATVSVTRGRCRAQLDCDVSDLHALIDAAGLHTPLVLVGHSLGTNIVRRYAGVHPDDVAAMVLVDPPAQDLGHFLPPRNG